ncbi:unnamed protein product [Caenorhabditis angaria]|uniref:Uncharacterized protein n=1 Tax=Caenorhabditis angaria TaxID=860376 RepID=A0A9P1IQA7_9PELO|nr:unnamed protein product [Caenorhabditis angaria]
MFTHTTDIKWTAASLRKVLENYVVRNRIKPNSLQAIGDVENDETFCSNDAKYRLQTIIMDKSNGDLDIYGGSKELMKDLQTLQYFPNNSDFLGITDPKCEDCYSFSTTINFFHDKSGREHVSKNDLSMMVVNVLGSFYNHKTRDKLFYALLIPSLGKQMRKQLVGSYELISIDLFNRVQAEVFTIMTAQQKPSTNKDFKPIKHTVDEIFSIFARFFEGENDKNVMDLLKTTIFRRFRKSFPIAFHKFNDDVQRDNVIRVFKDNGTSFCFAKDVEIEFRIQDLNVETEEERKNGILRTIDFSKLQDMLKESKIKLDEKMIIEQDIIRTSRNISVPIITFYGTHCKLASDAFFEVFNHVLHGLRLFQGVNKSNIPKIYNWFSQLYDVFDSESKRYFIETWKIEEIVERAYKDLEKFVTEKIYECPREPKLYMTDISEEEVIKEVEKLSKNFELNSKFIKSRYYFYRRSVNLEVPRKYIYKIFEDCVVLRFLNENPKYHRFIHNQGLCANIELFECDCQKSLKEGELEKRSKVEILKCAHLETVYFDCNRRNKKCLVAIRNKKFYDNTTAYELAMEKCVEFENTYDLRLTELLFESLKQKLGGDFREKRGIFYVREDELKELCDETRKSFTEGCRVAYQNIDNKNTRIVTWNEVYNRLKVFFLVDGFIKPSFKKLKDQLKKHENAKDLGLPEKDVCRIQALYRQIFQNHQRLFKVTQNLTNFSIYERKDRGNILRIMCERRVDYTEWHLLDEEVLDAIKFVLKSEKRYHLYRDKIEQWEIDLYRGKHQNCVGVKLFDTILNVLQIDKRKFLLVPDIQVIQHLILMPLQMAYHSIQIDTPMGDTSLHYIQAQYYVFQRIVCDINWMHLEEEDVIEYRKKILETMKRYKRGYYSESSVCSDVRNLTENKIYEMAKKNNDRTSIAYCQRKKFDALLSKDEFSEILFKAFGNTPEVVTGCQNFLKSLGFDTQSVVFEIENWKAKYIFMRHWMNVFFGDDEQEIHSNILKAFTATMPNIKIQSPVDTVYKLYRKSEEKNRDFDKNDLLEMHEWDKKARKSNDFEEYALFSDKEEEDSESKDSGDNVDQPENESCPQVVMNDDLKVIKENNKKIENCNRCYDFREEFEQVKKKVEELYKKTQMKDKDVKDLEKNLERLNRDKEYELKNLRKNFLEQNRKRIWKRRKNAFNNFINNSKQIWNS